MIAQWLIEGCGNAILALHGLVHSHNRSRHGHELGAGKVAKPREQVTQANLIGLGQLNRRQLHLVAERVEVLQPQTVGLLAQLSHGNQSLHTVWRRPVTVLKLGQNRIQLSTGALLPRRCRKLVVGLKAQTVGVDVSVRNVRVDRQFKLEFGRSLAGLTLELGNCVANHAQIQVEPDAGDVATLFATKQVSGTANLEVLQRNLHATAKFVVGGDGRKAVVRGLG